MTNPRLTVEEVRELLPLYAAGGLTSDQRREVESMLRADPALNSELAFWRSVAQISRHRSQPESVEHVDPEALVHFAEEPSVIGNDQRALIEAHLRACPDCRTELSMLQRSMAPPSVAFNWRFAAAAVVLLAALGTLLAVRPDRDATSPDTRIVIAQVPYVESYRAPAADDDPLVRIDVFPTTDSVVLHTEVPLPSHKATALVWSIRPPGQPWNDLAGTWQARVDPNGYTILWMGFAESMFAMSGRYRLRAISPEDGEFFYEVEVVRH